MTEAKQPGDEMSLGRMTRAETLGTKYRGRNIRIPATTQGFTTLFSCLSVLLVTGPDYRTALGGRALDTDFLRSTEIFHYVLNLKLKKLKIFHCPHFFFF